MSTVDTVKNQEACVCRQLSWKRGFFPQLHLSDLNFRGSFQPLLCWLAAYLELRGGFGELSELVPGNLFMLQKGLDTSKFGDSWTGFIWMFSFPLPSGFVP